MSAGPLFRGEGEGQQHGMVWHCEGKTSDQNCVIVASEDEFKHANTQAFIYSASHCARRIHINFNETSACIYSYLVLSFYCG